MTAPLPYAGVSGLVSRTEVLAALSAFPACGRQLMVGVLASEKTLAGQQNRWHRRYPRVENIAGIFADDPRCLNLMHFGADTPPDGDTLARLFELAGPRCHGFQFNGAWPYNPEIRTLRRLFERAGREPRIVLQAGPHVLGACPTSLDLVMRVSAYADAGIATDILIDASAGRGEPLHVDLAEFRRRDLLDAFPHLGVGVAGGLSAEMVMVPRVARLLQSGASCDAEGKLRDGADGGGRLMQEKVAAYLEATVAAVREARCVACDDPVPADAKALGWSYGTFVDGNAVWLCPDCKPLE